MKYPKSMAEQVRIVREICERENYTPHGLRHYVSYVEDDPDNCYANELCKEQALAQVFDGTGLDPEDITQELCRLASAPSVTVPQEPEPEVTVTKLSFKNLWKHI